ncbi:MAG: superinfection exclusion B family protein [Chloroflexi bacterium]|nr:superinfection exclusion B family protein [Chloroflexota bacterium]
MATDEDEARDRSCYESKRFCIHSFSRSNLQFFAFYLWIQNKRHQSAVLQERQKRLHNLTRSEKAILKGYLGNQTRSQYLPIESGVVNGLEAEDIIYRASHIGKLDEWAFNIQPWAWDYLTDHPELLFVKEKPKM